MSEHSINHLGKIAERILDTLSSFMKMIVEGLNYLKKIPELVQKVLDAINEGFNRQIQAIGEIEIYTRIANIEAKRHLVYAENESIQDFKQQLEEDIKSIHERYSKIQSDLNNQAIKRIREIDSHLLDLPLIFPEELANGYSTKVEPFLDDFNRDSNSSQTERILYVNEVIDDTISSINEFLEIRKNLLNKIKQFQFDNKIEDELDFNLPIFYSETIDIKTDEKMIETYLPGRFVFESNGKISKSTVNYVSEDSLHELQSILSKAPNQTKLWNSVNWSIDNNVKPVLKEGLTEFFRDNFKRVPRTLRKKIFRAIDKSEIHLVKM